MDDDTKSFKRGDDGGRRGGRTSERRAKDKWKEEQNYVTQDNLSSSALILYYDQVRN